MLLVRSGLARHALVDALEGIGHALRYVATVHLMCDPGDLGHALVGAEGEQPTEEELPTLYLFERYPGGVGFHEPLYAEAETLLARLALLLDNCRCEDGCPGCVGAPAPVAHPADRPRSRKAARAVLGALTGAPRRG
jgi:DEAD/DEAH box helicase domain-containing protein